MSSSCPACHQPTDESSPFCQHCGANQRSLTNRTIAQKYRVGPLIAEGGMGAVYTGEQQLGSTTRKVAIKTLHPELSRNEETRERFQREVGVLASLEHPNTVQVFDFGTDGDDLLFIVMELVQGRSLADLVARTGPLPTDRVESILLQIAGSLAEAHDKGIIHRDLKPDNIIVSDRAGNRDFVKVLDFGIAKRLVDSSAQPKLTQQGTVLGTPPYMSPEQFTGGPIDARSDIYSLGIIAYEMVTGTLPFAAKQPFEWATLHMTALPKPLEQHASGAMLSHAAREAIMKALRKDPAERFASAREFFAEFARKTAAPGPLGMPPVGDGRMKTQIGEPLAFAMSPAPAAPVGQPQPLHPAPLAPPSYVHHAPIPAAAAARTERDDGRGPNKALLLGIAGVVGLASLAAILVGSGVFKSRGDTLPTPDFGAPIASSAATVPAEPAPSSSPTSEAVAPGPSPTLTPPPAPAPAPAPKPTPGPTPQPQPPSPAPKPPAPTPPTPTPPAPTPPTPTPPTPTPPTPTPPTPTPPTPTPPTPTPPTPTPPTPPQPNPAQDPCALARTARERGLPPAVIDTLERRCKNATK